MQDKNENKIILEQIIQHPLCLQMNVPITQAGASVACAKHTTWNWSSCTCTVFFASALPALSQSLFALPDDCSMLHFFLALICSDGPSFSTCCLLYSSYHWHCLHLQVTSQKSSLEVNRSEGNSLLYKCLWLFKQFRDHFTAAPGQIHSSVAGTGLAAPSMDDVTCHLLQGMLKKYLFPRKALALD